MAQRLHTFPNDSMQYLVSSWDEVDTVCLDVAKKIHQSGKQFDRLVSLAKGGWPFTRSLVDLLAIPEVASIGIRFYASIGERLAEPQIYQDLPVEVKGEHVLLFDDVADSGESLAFTKEHLLNEGVASVTTATLYYKPRSIFLPDFYGDQTSAWIVFPFETREGMSQLKERWANQHLDEQTLVERFTQMGLKPAAIEYYQNL